MRTGEVTDKRLGEISGIVPIAGWPRHYWAHNDSGDGPRIFAIRDDGKVVAEVKVSGAAATDWEDIAAGPGPGPSSGPGPAPGKRWLYIGDVGNNDRDRKELVVWRILEPALAAAPSGREPLAGQKLSSEPAEPLRFRYPGGPFDCEAIAVHPATRAVYILTKELLATHVFRIRGDAGAPALQTAEEVAAMTSCIAVTGADIAPDGRRLLVRTYLQVAEYVLPEGRPFEDVFREPRRDLPSALLEVQGEAACYDLDGLSYVTVDELKPRAIHRASRAPEARPAPEARTPAAAK
ncbi:MAG: hypothetical protein HY721_10020 [Planctomycetes bacterium]|nr:hypothetical protein [Planctomycetota bacterium]